MLYHSAKGTTWKKHKYIAIKNGRYIYPSTNKRSAYGPRSKINSLTKKSPNIVKDSLQISKKDSGVISDISVALAMKNDDIQKNINRFSSFANDLMTKEVNRRNLEKTYEVGLKAINSVLKTNYKSTGIIDLEGRGVKVEIGNIYLDTKKNIRIKIN